MTLDSQTFVPVREAATVLFADIHGYTRLMSRNELATFERVNRSISLIRSLIGDYGGRVVQIAGDGVLALFEHATQALRFAIELQREFRNEAVWTIDGEPISFRIGINSGEVLISDGDVQGHCVNVAARIQQIAKPGGICISAAVRRAVDEGLSVQVRPLGKRLLKNIDEPVELFALEINGPPRALPLQMLLPAEQFAKLEQASIAFLPLVNATGDPRDHHLCDGVTGDIIANLSRFRELLVIAQHSVRRFRQTEAPLEQIGSQLGVRYVASGSLQRTDHQIRLRVELADVGSQRVLWSDRYDGHLSEIFLFLDDVTRMVASRLAIQVNLAEQQRILAEPPDLRSYGMVLRGRALSQRYSRELNLHARRLFEQAAALDPGYGASYAGMSRTFNIAWRYHWTDEPEACLERAFTLAREAIGVDALDARGFSELGFAHLYKRQHDESLAAYERAIDLNPNDADVMAEMANAVSCAGEPERAIQLLERAMRLNPYFPDWYLWHLGEVHFDIGNYDETIRTLNRMQDKSEAHRLLAASYALTGEQTAAAHHATELMKVHPEFSLEYWQNVPPDKNVDAVNRFIEGLRRAGLK